MGDGPRLGDALRLPPLQPSQGVSGGGTTWRKEQGALVDIPAAASLPEVRKGAAQGPHTVLWRGEEDGEAQPPITAPPAEKGSRRGTAASGEAGAKGAVNGSSSLLVLSRASSSAIITVSAPSLPLLLLSTRERGATGGRLLDPSCAAIEPNGSLVPKRVMAFELAAPVMSGVRSCAGGNHELRGWLMSTSGARLACIAARSASAAHCLGA